jgi:DNA-directed RNA polymerase specialized sigma24 family protein
VRTPEENATVWKSLQRRRFTEVEDAVVMGMATTYSLKEIAEHMGRPISSIQSACRRLGVRTVGSRT